MSLTAFRSLILIVFFCFSISITWAGQAPANDNCTAPILLTSSSAGVCSAALDIQNATNSAPTGSLGGATSTTTYDVWFTYKAKSTPVTINFNLTGSEFATNIPYIEVFSGSCGSFTLVASGTATSRLTVSGLTANSTYYIRMYVKLNPNVNGSASAYYGYTVCLTDPPANDDCGGAVSLTSNTTCTTTTSTMDLATASSGITAGCAPAGTHYDVWYSFTAASTTEVVTISNTGSTINNSAVQIFSGACGSLISLACGSTTATATGLTINNTYYVRVSNVGSDPSGSGTANFDICVTHAPQPPANDDCASADALTIATGKAGTVWLATNSGISTVCSGTPDDDVWYTFIPSATSATVTLSGVGTNLATSGAMIQVFSGSCGSLTSIACGTSGMTALGLTPGSTYYVRVYSSGAGSIGGTSAGSVFTINVTGPTAVTTSTVGSGRMNEVFKQTILSGSNAINYPWEVTYGTDDKLWITDSRGYKVYRMDPNTGAKTTVLDLSSGSTFLPSPSDTLNAVNSSSWSKWPQGGLAGLALHPKFLDGTGTNDYVYVSYVHRYLSGSAAVKTGMFFRNKLVRFTYNTSTNRLESPVVLCDTLPGSSDHNSQRIIIAPVVKGGTYYLFYAQGDMGAGQYENRDRPEKAQIVSSYEGKILRFNLISDGDSGGDAWIPNDNPFNTTSPALQSAVYSTGIRNNQGFAYDTSLNILYGASHGPYSDDEINVIESGKNYGHPLVIGFAADGNANNTSAGAPLSDNGGVSSCPIIVSESANAASIGSSYKDPIFSGYPNSPTYPSIYNLWSTTTGGNAQWPTEAWSGLDLYTHTLIPGWKKSLVAASLKWGRLLRLRMNATGNGTAPSNSVSDTISYFGSTNRFRDLAFGSNGKDIYVIMDNSSTTSGPGAANPLVPACAGCVQKYTFLGYNTGTTGRSLIPTTIDVTTGTANTCVAGTTITIDNSNNTIWVPITGPDGNIMAEIKANGNNLGTVTSSFYTNIGPVRENSKRRLYLDRNMTITPEVQPTSAVSIRLYITAGELNAIKAASNSQGASSLVNSISNLSIYKNSDACGGSWVNVTTPTVITPLYAEAHGASGYVLQADITSFSSFYFANTNAITLPLNLLTFKGQWQDNNAMLQWETSNEVNTSHFIIERSTDGRNFTPIGNTQAAGNSNGQKYSYPDKDAGMLNTGILYYRLKMYDLNGTFSYSNIVSITVDPSAMVVNIYPNPVHSIIMAKVSLKKADNLNIQVTDMKGQAVYMATKSLGAGASEIQIDTRKWTSQVYSIKITDSNNKVLITKNIVKL
jgi:trimeric autotransporter adhesin